MGIIRPKNKQCGKKKKYKTQKKAGEGQLFYHGFTNEYNTYLCPHCGYYHVGHKIKEDT